MARLTTLASHYRAFRVDDPDRILLTGHSHQAWPDVAREGVLEAFDDAAVHADEKWERAFAKADEVRGGFRLWLDDPDAEIALGASTHDLVIRLLSALPLTERRKLVTTDGEFHTLRRQLARLGEDLLEVTRVAAQPTDTLAARLADATDDRTAAVFVSAVLFETADVVRGLGDLAHACARHGAELVVDVYHALGPVPWSLREERLDGAWVVGGGYKYLQLGEGNCFLRLPPHAGERRPAVTGWYAEFAALTHEHDPARVAYASDSHATRFAGSTYDPTSHYRAARVMRFFAEHDLTPQRLPEGYARQTALLVELLADVPGAPRAHHGGGGFVALRTPDAAELQRGLRARGVLTDSRGDVLRLGPAPYLSDAQLAHAVHSLADLIRG